MLREKTVFFCLCFCHLVGVFGDELKSVMEGESLTLQSGVPDVSKMGKTGLIKWTFGTIRSLIAKIYPNKPIDIPNDLDERFRGRLELNEKTGSLTITHITTEHSGVYDVEISLSNSSTKHRFNVTVTAAPTTQPPSTSHSTSRPTSGSTSGSTSGLIVSISAVVAGLLLLLAAIVIFFIYRKHRKTHQQETVEPHDGEVIYADTTFHKRNAPSVKQEEDVVYAGIVTKR